MKSILAGLAVCGCAAAALAVGGSDRRPPRSPVHRGPQPPPVVGDAEAVAGSGPAVYPNEVRGIDGAWNNTANPTWGAAGIPLLRQVAADYADGAGAPSGTDRPSTRLISNLLCEQSHNEPNGINATSFLWQWGQFLDHDIDETPIASPAESFDIDVPAGDAWFDPMNTGTVTIPLDRSAGIMIDGVRQQLNNITAYIDASNVYGSDEPRAMELRTLDGTGKLKTSPGGLLPFNVNNFDNAPTPSNPGFFLAGDVRCNEQAGLTAMHTLFVREHNYWAQQIAAKSGPMAPDTIYNQARAIVGAEMQAITYREFLPILLGPDALDPYTGYDPSVNAGIANVFATAAYRVGHTMLSSELKRLDANGDEIPAGNLSLAQAFFNPSLIVNDGIAPLLRGLAQDMAQDTDLHVIDDVRNLLFGRPGSGGLDLPALNVQRGRDHGLPSYNTIRVAFGRPAATSFADITDDASAQQALAALYANVDDVDAWIGLIAEPHRPGAMVGETLFRVLRDQFTRLRDGDRFWYEAYLPPKLVDLVEQQTLATIIRRNTEIGDELQDNVFVIGTPCVADANLDGTVDVDDLLEVILSWGECRATCPGDIDNSGEVDVDDLVAVLTNWGEC